MSVWTPLSARRIAGFAVVLAIALPVGCTGMQFGNSDPGLVQEGEVTVQPNQEVDVYYSAPYASVPDLETYWPGRCVVIEQTTSHFRVRNSGGSPHKVAWKASGTAAAHVPQPSRTTRPSPSAPPGPAGTDAGPAPGNAQETPPRPVTIGPPQ